MSGPVRGPWRGQRLLDWAVVAVVAVPAAVVGGVAALAVRCTSPGPVLFRQVRVGRDGGCFEVLKFRTMVDDDNPVIPDAERITPVGRVLRRTSIDELPQLLNVVRGDMSVVGPRPTLPYQVERWTPRQRRRLDVRPGITGLAQVRGRNDLGWAERIEHDLEYVERCGARLDLAILGRTLAVVLTGTGSGATAADDPIARVERPAA